MLSFEQIRTKLKDRNVTTVAKSLGITRVTIYRFQKGGNISSATWIKLSDYLEKEG